MASGTPASPGVLANRLDHLFRTVLHEPDDGSSPREHTYAEVAAAINAAAGTSLISPHYLGYLRLGRRGATGRTSRDKLRAIAGFFGVPVEYFDDAALAAEVDSQLDVIAALRIAGVRAIATQAAGLPPAMLESILRMTVAARALAGLPPVSAVIEDEHR